MPWNVSRAVNTVRKEILKFPAGLDAIESVVLRASGVAALPSATTGYVGKLGLLAGTILTPVSGDSQNRYKKYTGSGDIAGILGDNVYFFDGLDHSDEPADMLIHGCVFDKDRIIDFVAYESALRTALNTCRFD
jgi:hypothetical protein